jgi:putative transposase
MPSYAWQQAIGERRPLPGLIHHADRGVPYARRESLEQLQAIGAQISRSALGNPYDHAKAERFFQTGKQEEVSLKAYHACADAEQNVTLFIGKMSNENRRHSRLWSLPPAACEAASTPLTGC